MRRLERYVLAEVATPFVVGVLLIVVILLGDQMHQMLRLLITQDVGLGTIVRLLLFLMPDMSVTAMPLATILAVSVGINRLAVDNEWATMRVSGVSFQRLMLPVTVFGALVAGASWFVGELVAPLARQEFDRLLSGIQLSNPAVVIQPERWLDTPAGDARFYVKRVDHRTGRLRELLILSDLDSTYPSALMAQEAYFDDEGFVMVDVIRHVWRADGTLQRDARTERARVELRRLTLDGLSSVGGLPEQMTSAELRRRIAERRDDGLGPVSDLVALHKRYALSTGCWLLALLCAPLAVLTARRGGYAGFLVAALLVIAYFLTVQLGASLAVSPAFAFSPPLGVWLQNGAFGLLAVALAWRCR